MDVNKVDEDNQRSINDGDWVCPDSQYVFYNNLDIIKIIIFFPPVNFLLLY